ncbi:MAG: BrnT family toxin [Chloroflexota bacterium]|nr:BrnT family toxin [Chloroflexota bacterium]
MDFEWDDAKRQANLAKHRVDFVDVQELFDGRPVFTAVSQHPDEQRFVTTGILDGRFYTVVWTWRGDSIRLISARRARDAEQRHYRALHGGGA